MSETSPHPRQIRTLWIPGLPVPQLRMTQRSRWGCRAKVSLGYQQAVAWRAKGELPRPWPTAEDRIGVGLTFLMPEPFRADLDNLVKAVLDGLQYGGVVPNDRQVDKLPPVRIAASDPAQQGVHVFLWWPAAALEVVVIDRATGEAFSLERVHLTPAVGEFLRGPALGRRR